MCLALCQTTFLLTWIVTQTSFAHDDTVSGIIGKNCERTRITSLPVFDRAPPKGRIQVGFANEVQRNRHGIRQSEAHGEYENTQIEKS